jgi:hypothetical protein
VAPVKQSLDKLDGSIQGIEKAREGAYSSLTTQVQLLQQGQGDLRRETSNLVNALRQPAARGRWGELQLRRVVEMAGMLSHCDFVEQVSVTGDDGRMRPDLVVRMPGGANIVVDAKAPLAAYLEAVDTEDEDARRLLFAAHCESRSPWCSKTRFMTPSSQKMESPGIPGRFRIWTSRLWRIKVWPEIRSDRLCASIIMRCPSVLSSQ